MKQRARSGSCERHVGAKLVVGESGFDVVCAAVVVHHDHEGEVRRAAANLVHASELRGVGHESENGARIAKRVLDIGHAAGRVDGDEDAAEAEDRQFGLEPLQARWRDDGHAIAVTNAALKEAERQRSRFAIDRGPGAPDPLFAIVNAGGDRRVAREDHAVEGFEKGIRR